MMEYNLKIDAQFKALIPPLSSEERRQLEENIVRDGCREPLCVWNNTILDGHNRYEICTALDIPFRVAQIFLKNREDAVVWICVNQLGRRNLSEESRRYLIGKRYEMEKRIGAHNMLGFNQHRKKEVRYKNVTEPHIHETCGRTRERLGHEYNVSGHSVARYGRYTRAVDALSSAEQTLAPIILSGKAKITYTDVIELSQLSPLEIREVAARLSDNENGTIQCVRLQTRLKSKPYVTRAVQSQLPIVAIKEIPAYDPDASTESLIFTIPSWISAIERTSTETNYTAVTPAARLRLEESLHNLTKAIENVFDKMEENVCER